jgi:hypothetical protein
MPTLWFEVLHYCGLIRIQPIPQVRQPVCRLVDFQENSLSQIIHYCLMEYILLGFDWIMGYLLHTELSKLAATD